MADGVCDYFLLWLCMWASHSASGGCASGLIPFGYGISGTVGVSSHSNIILGGLIGGLALISGVLLFGVIHTIREII